VGSKCSQCSRGGERRVGEGGRMSVVRVGACVRERGWRWWAPGVASVVEEVGGLQVPMQTVWYW
jgi:hypothetical protein